MSHSTVKLRPGVSEVTTPTLNEAVISVSQLIRFLVDPTYGPLVQKLGGWTKFFPNPWPSIVRALWGWEDTNGVTHLAVGCENIGMTGSAQLSVVTNGSSSNITPTSTTDNVAVSATTISGDPIVKITDATTTGITDFDAVYIMTHISVGGIVLFGLYSCALLSPTQYEVESVDKLGAPLPATASVTNGGAVAEFTTTSGSSSIQVTLNNHGYQDGSTYPCLVSTTVSGVTIYGNYIVQSVVDADNFIILGSTTASASSSAFINGGDARYTYSFGIGAVPGGSGFGIGGFGRGGFGTGSAIVPATGPAIAADDWTLDNWGEILLACPINGTLFQPIYAYDPLSGGVIAAVIPEAPPLSDGMFVAMPQRQIIAWGTTVTGIQDPLLIRWCDVNDYNTWIGSTLNQAGQFRISRGSKIVGCIQAPQQGLIWTDLGVWSMQYVGPDIIYSFNEIGYGCGLIARKAVGVIGGVVYWMGPSQFYVLSGDGVAVVPCSVWDVVFQNIDTSNLSKIRCAVNSEFTEIAWYFPSAIGGGEVDSYVKFNVTASAWDYGTLGRSAWIDVSVLGPPIGADPATLYAYQHETSNDADGTALVSSFRSNYFSLDDGDWKVFVDQFWPDMKWGKYGQSPNATLQVTFFLADYPGDTPVPDGPYSITQDTQWISPRFRTRLVAVQFESDDIGSFWRIGANRYRVIPDGRF